jgi:GT2 family glycosyltransferase
MSSQGASVLAVVVTYRREWTSVRSGDFLVDTLGRQTSDGLTLERALIYDNSPEPTARPSTASDLLVYVHDPRNRGTQAAYWHGLELARSKGHDWLLLLDQDTALPPDYLASVSRLKVADLDVLLPNVVHGNKVISPGYLSRWGSVVSGALPHSPSDKGTPTGIASGAMIRSSALQRLGKPPAELWLDFLDHWMFWRLHMLGCRFGALDTWIAHDLSIERMDQIPVSRLHSIWNAERRFMADLPWTARLTYPTRQLNRMMRLMARHPAVAAHLWRWWTAR